MFCSVSFSVPFPEENSVAVRINRTTPSLSVGYGFKLRGFFPNRFASSHLIHRLTYSFNKTDLNTKEGGASSLVNPNRGSLEVCELVRCLGYSSVPDKVTQDELSSAHLNKQFRSPNLPGGVACIRHNMKLKLRPGFLQLPSRLGL